jgi:hypothetical protein
MMNNLAASPPLRSQMGTGSAAPVHTASERNSGQQDPALWPWASGFAMLMIGAFSAPAAGGTALGSNTLQNFAALSKFTAPRGKFFDELAQYERDDWDGDGAKPVARTDSDIARRLLDSVAPDIAQLTPPDIVAGADGSICMEWIRQGATGQRKMFVDVGPNGRVLTFAKFGSATGIEKHFDQFGPEVLQHLRLMFSVYSMG